MHTLLRMLGVAARRVAGAAARPALRSARWGAKNVFFSSFLAGFRERYEPQVRDSEAS